MSYWWWLIPITFYVEQNNFYGWNGTPKSDGELIADGITLALVILVAIGTKENVEIKINHVTLERTTTKEEETHL